MYREAEIAAMNDVPEFVHKSQQIYGYQHFVNDVGGSLCELDEPSVIDLLVKHTLILYIQVTDKAEEQKLIDRAQSDPKPLVLSSGVPDRTTGDLFAGNRSQLRGGNRSG